MCVYNKIQLCSISMWCVVSHYLTKTNLTRSSFFFNGSWEGAEIHQNKSRRILSKKRYK